MRHALAVLWIATTLPVLAAEPAAAGLTLGSVAMDIPAVMHQRLLPLAAYLSRELQRPVELRPAPALSKAADEVARGAVDIAYLTPVAYVNARQAGQVQPVAKPFTAGRGNLRLMLVTRADSPVRTVRDLVGKRFAFGDAAALLQRAVVVNAGIRLEELGAYRFLGHYDNIARGVANGDFDAGILKDSIASEWERKGLRILYTSPELPPYNIAVSRRLGAGQVNAIQQALLRLDPSKPEHRQVIKALDQGYEGFAVASDADYDIVRELIRPVAK
jgi:phosphonate transport system substrate-binding protein